MNIDQLSRLEKVAVRDIWPDEARDFTPWLAQESNIALLGETIGLELEFEAQEKSVGPFKADILCKETTDDHYVLIENQLERTNHTHLGQLMTYAAGLHAATIVWIADRFTDEHRAALDWLNEITADEFRFFGLEIEAWKIGDSPAAPKFNVVSKPNDWSADIEVSKGELSDTKKLQLEYWKGLRALLDEDDHPIPGTKPRPQHWTNFSIGRSKFGMHASVNTQAGFTRVGISCKGPNALAHFELLQNEKEEIEAEIGAPLEWEELPNRKESRIAIRNQDIDFSSRNMWPTQHAWLKEKLRAFNSTFRQRIRDLDVADYESEQEEIDE